MKTMTEAPNPTKQNPEIVEELKDENAKPRQENELLSARIKWYEEQIKLGQAKRFGASSDTVPPEQVSFINEAEVAQRPEKEEPNLEQITYERRKKRGTHKEAFKDLPVERVIYDLPIDEQSCPACHGTMHAMSEEIRRELKVIPAQISIVEHVQKVYTCRACQESGTKVPVVTAKMPAPVISGSFVSPSLLVYICHQKYVAVLPLYRQEQIFKEFGIEISRQNMANWINKGSELWLEALFERMHHHLLKESFLHADETTLRVLDQAGKATDSKAYMWLYVTGRFGKRMALYEYQPSRAGKHPRVFLEGYSGLLQSDDYSGYNLVNGVTRVGCFAHARRNFTDALKALPKETPTASTMAHEALAYFKKLFELEAKWTGLSAEERYEQRIIESQPFSRLS